MGDHTVKARWAVTCAKCDTTIPVGGAIKPQYVRRGMNPETGRPIWVRVPKAYVHAPRCPKVTPNKPGQRHVDPRTGEIIVEDSVSGDVQLTLGGV